MKKNLIKKYLAIAPSLISLCVKIISIFLLQIQCRIDQAKYDDEEDVSARTCSKI